MKLVPLTSKVAIGTIPNPEIKPLSLSQLHTAFGCWNMNNDQCPTAPLMSLIPPLVLKMLAAVKANLVLHTFEPKILLCRHTGFLDCSSPFPGQCWFVLIFRRPILPLYLSFHCELYNGELNSSCLDLEFSCIEVLMQLFLFQETMKTGLVKQQVDHNGLGIVASDEIHSTLNNMINPKSSGQGELRNFLLSAWRRGSYNINCSTRAKLEVTSWHAIQNGHQNWWGNSVSSFYLNLDVTVHKKYFLYITLLKYLVFNINGIRNAYDGHDWGFRERNSMWLSWSSYIFHQYLPAYQVWFLQIRRQRLLKGCLSLKLQKKIDVLWFTGFVHGLYAYLLYHI